jgi:transcriptional regulator with XRE-family HTH domain
VAFADILRAEREAGGWTQMSLAEASGVPVWTIRDLERGRRQPMLATAYKLAKALGVSLDMMAKAYETPSVKPRRRGRE